MILLKPPKFKLLGLKITDFFSIADGIALGFISYVTFKVVSGKHHEVTGGAWFLTAIFATKFAFS